MFKHQPMRWLTALFWLATVPVMAAGWLTGLPVLVTIATIASLLFVFVLMATLWRELPALTVPSATSGFPGFGATIALITAAILVIFVVGANSSPWIALSLVLSLVGLGYAIVWRREITLPLVILAFAAGLVCVGLGVASDNTGPLSFAYYLSVALAILGGGVMVRRTGLTSVLVADGKWLAALAAFGLGCVLALPSSFLNLASGIQNGDTWVDQAWEPLVALVPGIAEESFARLIMLTLCVVLLRRRAGANGWKVLVAALLISSYAHALAHLSIFDIWSPAGGMMVLAGLLFGLPMGLVFLRFGFEAAVGYHFTVDFVRFLAAYLAF
jgi:hypothetical protein